MSHDTARFALLRDKGRWRLLAAGATTQAFDYRVDAEEAALRLAQRAREAGFGAEILLQDQFGELRPLDIC